MKRTYFIVRDYKSSLGFAAAGSRVYEHDGWFFLPLDTGAVLQITPEQLKSSRFDFIDTPAWKVYSAPLEARAAVGENGELLVQLDFKGRVDLKGVSVIEINGEIFKK